MGTGGKQIETPVVRAYRVFRTRTPGDLGVCTACCMDPVMERAMLGKSPDALTPEEVREWLSAAFDGGRQQVCWIVPRILELLAEGAEVSDIGNEVALRRLRQTGFPAAWSDAQVASVTEMCALALERQLASGTVPLDDVLCMIASSGLAIEPYLTQLDRADPVQLAARLQADWRTHWGLSICRTTFWEDAPEARAVGDWYMGLADRFWLVSDRSPAALELAEFLAACRA